MNQQKRNRKQKQQTEMILEDQDYDGAMWSSGIGMMCLAEEHQKKGGFFSGLAGIFSSGKKGFEGVRRQARRRHQIQDEERPVEYVFDNNLEYLESSGHCLTNLKPSKGGELSIDLSGFRAYSVLQVAVGDNNSSLLVNYYLGGGRPVARDFRLAKSLLPGAIFKQDYRVTEPTKSSQGPLYTLSIANREQTSHLCIEDLGELMDCLLNVVRASVDKGGLLQKWGFLTKWAGLSASTRLEKLEELGGHELNVFVYFRDRVFFEEVLRPMLRFKAKKELIDSLLLGEMEAIEPSNELKLLEGRNMLELFLLCYCFRERDREFSLRVSEYVAMRTSRSSENLERRRRVLQSILNTQKGGNSTDSRGSHDARRHEHRGGFKCPVRDEGKKTPREKAKRRLWSVQGLGWYGGNVRYEGSASVKHS
jgi:hypothetical protein